MQEEIWKVYKDTRIDRLGRKSNTGALWEVSDQGRVKKNGKLYECRLLPNGYLIIKCKKYITIHRAVAELFIPNPENKPFIDHINGNKLDNRTINLRWVTAKENAQNRHSYKGENNPFYNKHHKTNTKRQISESLKTYYKNINI